MCSLASDLLFLDSEVDSGGGRRRAEDGDGGCAGRGGLEGVVWWIFCCCAVSVQKSFACIAWFVRGDTQFEISFFLPRSP